METVRDERFERFSVHFLRFRCGLCAREVRLAALAKGTPWARHPAGGAQDGEKSETNGKKTKILRMV